MIKRRKANDTSKQLEGMNPVKKFFVKNFGRKKKQNFWEEGYEATDYRNIN